MSSVRWRPTMGGGSGAVEKYASIPPYVEAHNYVKRVLGYYERDVSATP